METQKSYYITTEKMSVGYDGKLLIEEVEIMLRKGEILTLLGPNGAGKSTILKSIARQLSLIAGTVRLDGEDMKSLTGAELSKKMAVVMTKRLRAELMTCEDVVATGRYPYTGRFGVLSKDDHKAVENAMELVKVTELRIKEAVMWIFYAIGSSFFAGITAILAKCGIQKTDSDVATAIRTVVVLIFS